MSDKSKISPFQLFQILFLSRIFTLLSYFTLEKNDMSPLLVLILILVSFIFDLIILTPFMIINSKFQCKNILDLSNEISIVYGKIISVFFFVICVAASAISVAKFEFFLTSSVYSKASNILISIMFVIVSLYCVYMGFEALSRFAFIVFCFFIITVLFITLANLPKFDLLNIIPFNKSDINKNIFSLLIDLSLKNTEYFLVFLIVSKTRKSIVKTLFFWLLSICIVFEILSLFFYGVMGKTANYQLFPFYTLSSIAEFSIFQRLDALHIGVWVFIALIKSAVYMFFASIAIENIFKKMSHKIGILISGFSVLILSIFLSDNLENLEKFNGLFFSTPVYIIGIIILPIITLILYKFKKKEVIMHNEKNN